MKRNVTCSRSFVSRSERETERIAARFAQTLRGGEVILLDGDLGAGKTVFVRGLARGLGVRDRITSPTFVLMRVYRVVSRESRVVSKSSVVRLLRSQVSGLRSPRYLVHLDAYRIRSPYDLEAIGLLEYAGRPDTVVAIEWGSRVRDRWRRSAYHATLTSTSSRHRSITIVCPPSSTRAPRHDPDNGNDTMRPQHRKTFKR